MMTLSIMMLNLRTHSVLNTKHNGSQYILTSKHNDTQHSDINHKTLKPCDHKGTEHKTQ